MSAEAATTRDLAEAAGFARPAASGRCSCAPAHPEPAPTTTDATSGDTYTAAARHLANRYLPRPLRTRPGWRPEASTVGSFAELTLAV